MYCYKCGHKLRSDAVYCISCGVKVADIDETEPLQENNNEVLDNTPIDSIENSDLSSNEGHENNQKEAIGQTPMKWWTVLGMILLGMVMLVLAKVGSKALMGPLLEYAHSTPYRSMLFLNIGVGALWGGLLALVPWFLLKHYDVNNEYAWGKKCIFAINISIGIIGGLTFSMVGAVILTCGIWYALAKCNK